MHNLDKKDPERGLWDLWEAQIHWGIKEKHLLTPVSNRFAYLLHLFRSLMENKSSLEYLYGTMPGIHHNIRVRRPPFVDWGVIQMIVTIMKRIVGIILINQFSGNV